jgi:hypothetical protein
MSLCDFKTHVSTVNTPNLFRHILGSVEYSLELCKAAIIFTCRLYV